MNRAVFNVKTHESHDSSLYPKSLVTRDYVDNNLSNPGEGGSSFSSFFPFFVSEILTSNRQNISSFTDLIAASEYIILSSQTDSDENGLYLGNGTKQDIDNYTLFFTSDSYIFYTTKFLSEGGKYLNFSVDVTTTDSTPFNLCNFPYYNSTIINLNIFVYRTSDKTQYKRITYSNCFIEDFTSSPIRLEQGGLGCSISLSLEDNYLEFNIIGTANELKWHIITDYCFF